MSPRIKPVTRRDVLRGLLGGAAVSVSLPWLEAFLDVTPRAHAMSSFPTRFGIVTWGNGNVPSQWTPEGVGRDWIASAQLAAWEPLRDKLAVVTGMEVRVPNLIPHYSGQYGFLTAVEPIGEEGANTVAAPTLDQIIAAEAEIGGATRFRSLETGADPGTGISYTGPYQPLPHESDPHLLFERLFGVGFREPGDDTPVDPRIALRRSVLDVVMDQAAALEKRLGANDKARLQAHLDGVRDLELRLARAEADPPNLAACSRPTAPSDTLSDELIARHRSITDLVVMALACDQTRVFSHAFTGAVNNHLYDGTAEGHHKLTHDEPGDQPQVRSIVLQIMEQLSYFVQKLDEVEEGDGTLLDHSMVLVTSDVSLGRTHGLDEFPILVAGSGDGRLNTGIHYRSETRENATKVGLTLMRAMGLRLDAWGEGNARVTDGLSALEA